MIPRQVFSFFMTIMLNQLIVIIALRFQWLCAIQAKFPKKTREKYILKVWPSPRLNKNLVTQLTKWWRSPYRLTGPTVGTVLIYQIKKRNFLDNKINFLNTRMFIKWQKAPYQFTKHCPWEGWQKSGWEPQCIEHRKNSKNFNSVQWWKDSGRWAWNDPCLISQVNTFFNRFIPLIISIIVIIQVNYLVAVHDPTENYISRNAIQPVGTSSRNFQSGSSQNLRLFWSKGSQGNCKAEPLKSEPDRRRPSSWKPLFHYFGFDAQGRRQNG